MTDVKRPPRRTRADQQRETRQRLLAAAIEVFVAEGIESARIEDIAARAGYTRGAFYAHFPRKEDAVVAALAAFRQELDALNQSVIAARPQATSTEVALDADRRARQLPVSDLAALMADAYLYARRHPEVRPELLQLRHQSLASGRRFLEELLARSGATAVAVDPEAMAYVLQAVNLGHFLFAAVDPDGIDPEPTIATLLGLLTRPDPPTTG